MATQNNTSEKQGCRDVGGGEESSRYPHLIYLMINYIIIIILLTSFFRSYKARS